MGRSINYGSEDEPAPELMEFYSSPGQGSQPLAQAGARHPAGGSGRSLQALHRLGLAQAGPGLGPTGPS
jgi:hypothetical protein